MLPGAVALAAFGVLGAFGSGVANTQTAHAANLAGDICWADTNATPADPTAFYNNANGPVDYVVNNGDTYGLVFRVADVATSSDRTTATTSRSCRTSTSVWTPRRALPASPARLRFRRTRATRTMLGYVWPDIWHNVRNYAASTTADVIDPDQFNDPDGNAVGDINTWLTDVAGMSAFADSHDNVCGNSTIEDAWGFIDFQCIEPGYFHIDILPSDTNFPNQDFDSTELGGMTLKFYCPGQADSATIATQYSKLETSAATGSHDSSIITVTVEDQFGSRLDGAEVTYSTNNCKFDSASDISPAGGGTTVTTWTDTGGTSDSNYLANNPLEHNAGTAEATLNCTKGTPGTATVTAIVQRPGSDIVLSQDVTVVGPTALTGLTLTLNPNDLECGNTILAVANAVDSLGQPVSDNTLIYFTTDTSSGVVGGLRRCSGWYPDQEW